MTATCLRPGAPCPSAFLVAAMSAVQPVVVAHMFHLAAVPHVPESDAVDG
ncbi:hypothetical protein [Streptomyces blattellae]|nr:hypothetical protein [Streptomyces blattellae]